MAPIFSSAKIHGQIQLLARPIRNLLERLAHQIDDGGVMLGLMQELQNAGLYLPTTLGLRRIPPVLAFCFSDRPSLRPP